MWGKALYNIANAHPKSVQMSFGYQREPGGKKLKVCLSWRVVRCAYLGRTSSALLANLWQECVTDES